MKKKNTKRRRAKMRRKTKKGGRKAAMRRVHKFRDNVNTDEIIPARYLNTTDRGELAAHCMEDIDERFSKRVGPGDIIVGGRNFGCGSSREHAPIAIKASGVHCVIAETFARIFFRNSINIGLPLVEDSQIVLDARDGDRMSVDLDRGIVRNVTRKKVYRVEKYPPFMHRIIRVGGLMNYVSKKVKCASQKPRRP